MTPIEEDLNVGNVQILINHLEKIPAENFNMGKWLEGPGCGLKRAEDLKAMLKQMETTGGCGTVGCIAGHAGLLARAFGFNQQETPFYYHVEYLATLWLGLSDEGARRLFRPCNKNDMIIDKKIPTVIRTLKHLRDTKRVSWSVPVSAYPVQ